MKHYRPSNRDEWILSHIPDMKKSIAIEYGCGDGYYTRMLSKKFRHIIAMDANEKSIDEAIIKNRAKNTAYLIADCTKPLTFIPSNSIDFAFCNGFLHHILSDLDMFFRELSRILKPWSVFMAFTEPNKHHPFNFIMRHPRNPIRNKYFRFFRENIDPDEYAITPGTLYKKVDGLLMNIQYYDLFPKRMYNIVRYSSGPERAILKASGKYTGMFIKLTVIKLH
jgi:ubiquinone/menaquinone biosynthesis C-methylase UbiE